MLQMTSTRHVFIAACCTFALLPALAFAQSDAASRQSQASLAASLAVPAGAAVALSEGGRFVVASVQATGTVLRVTIEAIGSGASLVVEVAAGSIAATGIAVGSVVAVTAVSAGWLLSVGGEIIAFVAGEAVRSHVHSRRLTR